MASPRPHRRHHHHHHHNHQCGSSSGGSSSKHHCPPPQSDEDVAPEPLQQQQLSAQQQQRKARRGTHGGWYNRHGKSQDSGRSSDSSTLSLSVGSTKRSDKLGSNSGQPVVGSLTSPLRGTPSSGRRTLDPPPLEFGIGSTASTPLSSRKKGSLELSRQRSLDSETGPVGSAGLLMGTSISSSTTPTPVRSNSSKPNDLFYRDGSLSRSLSFMQQRRPQTVIITIYFFFVLLLLLSTTTDLEETGPCPVFNRSTTTFHSYSLTNITSAR